MMMPLDSQQMKERVNYLVVKIVQVIDHRKLILLVAEPALNALVILLGH